MKPFDFSAGRAPARETVVLLHSSASSSRQWSALVEQLRLRYEVRAPDFHGHGGQPPARGGPSSLLDDAALVEPLLRGGSRVHLVGHSYGGAVALRLAALRPDCVASVVVFEPVLFRWLLDDDGATDAAREVVAVVDAIRKLLNRGDAYRAAGRFINYWSGAGAWETLPAGRRDLLAARMRTVLGHFEALFADRPDAMDLRCLRMPMLFLSGARTVASTRRIAAMLRVALPRARHEELAGMGHMGPVTDADRVNPMIAEFIAGDRRLGPPARVGRRGPGAIPPASIAACIDQG